MDLSNYREPKPHHLRRVCWCVFNATIFRCFPGTPLRFVRNLFLKAFGAKIPWKSCVYSSCKIWAPWNLKLGHNAWLGPNVICYNQALVTLEDNVTVSQYSYLCTAGHKTDSLNEQDSGLIVAPIKIRNGAWIGTRAYINMGVEIGEYAIIGATASVYKDVEPWTVVGGNPARFIKKRTIKDE